MIQHHDFDLSQVTTFHIPATARLYAEYESIDELRELLFSPMYIEMEHLHIGGGSNLLFTSPFDGVVMHSAIKHIETVRTHGDNVYLKVSAGVYWDDFVKHCVDNDLYGAENLSYIPGEAGASAVQNVGAYGVEAKDIISEVHTIDSLTGKEKIFSREDCDYGYRHSIFKSPGFSGRYIITHVVYRLSTEKHFTLEYGPLKEFAAENDVNLRKVRERIIEIRRNKLPEPDELGSAGSFFKNPVITPEKFRQLKADYPELPSYPAPDGVKIPAAWLIENTGMKGKSIGGAQVYTRQCLVIVNTGNATAADVVALYEEIKEKVAARFGITLSPEVNIIGKL